jgi:hypothetical protein
MSTRGKMDPRGRLGVVRHVHVAAPATPDDRPTRSGRYVTADERKLNPSVGSLTELGQGARQISACVL